MPWIASVTNAGPVFDVVVIATVGLEIDNVRTLESCLTN